MDFDIVVLAELISFVPDPVNQGNPAAGIEHILIKGDEHQGCMSFRVHQQLTVERQ